MWANPNAPNLPDYITFTQTVMGIDPLYLPPSSPILQYALDRAIALTLNVFTGAEYTIAVYNGAGHIQLTITPDVGNNGALYTFFRDKRVEYDLLKPSTGLLSATGDQGTSFTYAVPDALQQLTIQDLDFFKTVWGRYWLSYSQDFGVVHGLS